MNYSENNPPYISFIIPALNAEGTIGLCLDAIMEQINGRNDVEIIVVDNGSTDKTAAIVSRYPSTKIVKEQRRGRAQARNRGISVARGEIVVFCDSDYVPAENWLVELLKPFEDQTVGGVGGEILSYPPRSLVGHFYASKEFLSLKYFAADPDAYYPITGNVAYRMSAIKKAGLFDESFIYASEDTEFAMRIIEQTGLRLVPCYKAVGYHMHREDLMNFWEKAYRYGAGTRHFEQFDNKKRFDRKRSLLVFLCCGSIYYFLRWIVLDVLSFKKKDSWHGYFFPLLGYIEELGFRCGYAFAFPFRGVKKAQAASAASLKSGDAKRP